MQTAEKAIGISRSQVMKSKTSELTPLSNLDLNGNVKISNSNGTRMDSWRHISDIVKLERCRTGAKQTFTCVLIPEHKEGRHLIWFTPDTNSFWPILVCFCCKAACFFQFGLISCFTSNTLTWSDVGAREMEAVKGKKNWTKSPK